jgi:hypothetical protein
MSSVAGSNARSVTIRDLERSQGSRGRPVLAVLAAAVAVLWIPLTLLHPDSTDALADVKTGTWLAVHYAQLVLAPLLALAMLFVLGRLVGITAVAGSIAVVVWVALFSAFDSIAGIAAGVLVDGGFLGAADYLFDDGLVGGGSILGWVAQPMWILVAVASGVALRSNGASAFCWIAMLASVLFATHAGWVAGVGLLAVAMSLALATARPTRRRPSPSVGRDPKRRASAARVRRHDDPLPRIELDQGVPWARAVRQKQHVDLAVAPARVGVARADVDPPGTRSRVRHAESVALLSRHHRPRAFG